MTEVQFAKQFLTTLDSKNTKHQSDHAFDPKTFQMRIPYTLPKLSHPPHPLSPKSSTTAPAPGSEPVTQAPSRTIDITLKSTRNPAFTLYLPSLPQTTPISVLKTQIHSLLSAAVPESKIKILYNKKPIPPSKSTILDVLSDSTPVPTSTEFGVMVMGGAADPSPSEQTISLNNDTSVPVTEKTPVVDTDSVMQGVTSSLEKEYSEKEPLISEPVQPGQSSGKELLATNEFWEDLKGFLEQRLKDTREAERLIGLFRGVAS